MRRSTREHLLEIAGQVFAKKGFDAVAGLEAQSLQGAGEPRNALGKLGAGHAI
jgi:hypothetical protein